MSDIRDEGPMDGVPAPADGGASPAAPASANAISDAKPPSRRDAILRIGIVVAVLFVVFVVILPRFIDYQDVAQTLEGLTVEDFLIVGIFGLIVWVLTGAVFSVLIPGLGLIRGLQAYLILTGIGASIPLGPWNMAVLWVVIRGWGLPTAAVTGGIRLFQWGLPIPLAWVLLGISRRGKPLLPTRAEFSGASVEPVLAPAGA